MNDSIRVDNFSGGAWRLKVELEPFSGERTEMSVEDIMPLLEHSHTEPPLLVRINRTFLPVYEGQSIPYKVLAIPEEVEEELVVDLPSTKHIIIPKRQDQMKQILMEEEKFEWRIP